MMCSRKNSMPTIDYRGSQKHLLDLLSETERPFVELNDILHPHVTIQEEDLHCPVDYDNPDEKTIRAFLADSQLCETFDYSAFDSWWVPDEYKNPTWDLLSTCQVQGPRGLLLVEAKAHEGEIKEDGKDLPPKASAQSEANHEKISESITEASIALNGILGETVHLSIDSHYQLANRIATAWKLASCGLPAVLLYLGFTGDTYFRRDHFRDDAHWQDFMKSHITGVFPTERLEQGIDCGGATMTILIRSLPIKEKSVLNQ